MFRQHAAHYCVAMAALHSTCNNKHLYMHNYTMEHDRDHQRAFDLPQHTCRRFQPEHSHLKDVVGPFSHYSSVCT